MPQFESLLNEIRFRLEKRVVVPGVSRVRNLTSPPCQKDHRGAASMPSQQMCGHCPFVIKRTCGSALQPLHPARSIAQTPASSTEVPAITVRGQQALPEDLVRHGERLLSDQLGLPGLVGQHDDWEPVRPALSPQRPVVHQAKIINAQLVDATISWVAQPRQRPVEVQQRESTVRQPPLRSEWTPQCQVVVRDLVVGIWEPPVGQVARDHGCSRGILPPSAARRNSSWRTPLRRRLRNRSSLRRTREAERSRLCAPWTPVAITLSTCSRRSATADPRTQLSLGAPV
jgi:hypothetical protein